MTEFNSKVALLEKWHNIIRPEADLLAELIVDTWHEATEYSEQRIIKLLEADCEDNLTGKPDDCLHQDLIALIKEEGVMSDKEKEIAGLIVGAIKAGYKITFERNDIGAVKPNGYHMHVGFLDEVIEEFGTVSLSDYIESQLKGEK